MNLIECILGISTDGGSGLVEWLLLLMPVAVIAKRYIGQHTRARFMNIVRLRGISLIAFCVLLSVSSFGQSPETARAYVESSRPGVEKPREAATRTGGRAKRMRRDIAFDPAKTPMRAPYSISHRASYDTGVKEARASVGRTTTFGK